MVVNNFFSEIAPDSDKEIFHSLLDNSKVSIERIISTGQSSPPDYWYDQPQAEWVMLMSGSATILFENKESIDLIPGDYLLLPAHKKHRVEKTDANTPTYWIAVHFELS